jgi:hypothetical protein
MIDADGGNAQTLPPAKESASYIRDAVFSPNGNDVYGFWCGIGGCGAVSGLHFSSAIRRLPRRASSWETVLRLPPDTRLLGPPSLSPNGQALAYSAASGFNSPSCVAVADLSSGSPDPIGFGDAPSWQPTPVALALPEMSSVAQSLAVSLTPDQIHQCVSGLYDAIDVEVTQNAKDQKLAQLTSDLLKAAYVGKNFSFSYDIGRNVYNLYLNKARLQLGRQDFQAYLATYGIQQSWFKGAGQTIIEHQQ